MCAKSYSAIKVFAVLLALSLAAVIAAGCADTKHAAFVGSDSSSNSDKINMSLIDICSSGSPTVTEISWSTPTLDMDGNTLSISDIAGYKIYYGSSQSGNISASQLLSTAATSVNVQDTANAMNLEPGTYVVLIAAQGSAGNDVAYADTVCTEIARQ